MTVKQTVEITNKLGMHARPAMKLFELVQGFDAEVLLRNDDRSDGPSGRRSAGGCHCALYRRV